MTYQVILFHTTAMAMKAEKALARAGYQVSLIPTPRRLSSDCGIAVRFASVNREEIEMTLEKNGVETAGIYELKEQS